MPRATLGGEAQSPELFDVPEGVSLDRYAEIRALLEVRAGEPAAEILGSFGLDEQRFNAARKVWAERIELEVGKAAEPGQPGKAGEKYPLSMRYAAAYAEAARKARGEAEPGR